MHIWMRGTAAFGFAALIALTVSAGHSEPAPTRSMTIQMHQLNGSGQNGTATLTAVGSRVSVSVQLTGEPNGASEPAHVHLGHCPVIKAIPAYNVGPIVGGKATNIVDLTWTEITSGKYVLNVHESTATLGKYMSCGNIGDAASPMPLPTEDSGY
jgi:hypothetical protein